MAQNPCDCTTRGWHLIPTYLNLYPSQCIWNRGSSTEGDENLHTVMILVNLNLTLTLTLTLKILNVTPPTRDKPLKAARARA